MAGWVVEWLEKDLICDFWIYATNVRRRVKTFLSEVMRRGYCTDMQMQIIDSVGRGEPCGRLEFMQVTSFRSANPAVGDITDPTE